MAIKFSSWKSVEKGFLCTIPTIVMDLILFYWIWFGQKSVLGDGKCSFGSIPIHGPKKISNLIIVLLVSCHKLKMQMDFRFNYFDIEIMPYIALIIFVKVSLCFRNILALKTSRLTIWKRFDFSKANCNFRNISHWKKKRNSNSFKWNFQFR